MKNLLLVLCLATIVLSCVAERVGVKPLAADGTALVTTPVTRRAKKTINTINSNSINNMPTTADGTPNIRIHTHRLEKKTTSHIHHTLKKTNSKATK